MSLPPLRIKIDGDASGFDGAVGAVAEKLNDLESLSDRAASGLRSFGDGATTAGRKMLPYSAGVTAAATGMFLLAKGTASAGDEIAKSARGAGVSADALQELRFALGQAAGVGDQQTSSMLQRLTRRMGEAVEGNDTYADALGNLGISMSDVASGAVTTDEVFTRLAEAMQGADSDAEAAAMGMALLGREGSALGGQLRESGADIQGLRDRAQELGIVLGGDALTASEDFTDKMDELSKQADAAKNEIGTALLPVALALATAFQDRVVPAIVAVADGIGKAIEWFGNLPGPVQEAAGLVAAAIGAGGPVLLAVGVMSKAFAGIIAATGPIGLFIAAAGLLYLAWQKWGDDITAAVGPVLDWLGDKFGWVVDIVSAFGQGLIDTLTNLVDFFTAVFRGDIEGVLNAIGEQFQIWGELVDSIFEALGINIQETIGEALEWVRTTFNELVEWFMELPERFMELGRNIIAGLWEGLRAAWDEFSIMDTVRGWGASIGDVFGRAIRSRSPSQVFHEFGVNIGQGLYNGIVSTFGMVKSAVQGLGGQVTQGAFDMASGVVSAMGQMFQGSKPIAIAQAIINTFQGITEALKLPPPGNFIAAAKVAAQGFAAVRGIQNTTPSGGGSTSMSRPSSGSGAGGQVGSSGGGGSAEPQQSPTTTFQFTLTNDPMGFGEQFARQLVDQLNEAQRNGGNVRGVIA